MNHGVKSAGPGGPVLRAGNRNGRHMLSPVTMAEQLSAIPDLARDVLVERWTEAFGHPPPKGLSRRLLEYAAAYHLQARAYGGLPSRLRRKLRRLAATDHRGEAASVDGTIAAKIPPPGSRLVRTWHGRTHTVDVLENGFLYDGQRLGSPAHVGPARDSLGYEQQDPMRDLYP